MATADSPKDDEPPTIIGIPSELQYITLNENLKFTVGANIVRPHAAKPFPKKKMHHLAGHPGRRCIFCILPPGRRISQGKIRKHLDPVPKM